MQRQKRQNFENVIAITNFLIKMYDANPFESAHCLMASMITVIPVAPGGAALLVPLKVG